MRETFFGFTPSKIKSKIAERFKDYFDGDDYPSLGLGKISDLTVISEPNLLPIINEWGKNVS